MRNNSFLGFKGKYVFIFATISVFLVMLSSCTERKDEKSKKELTQQVKIETKFLGCQILDKLPDNIIPLNVNYGDRIKLLGISVNKNIEKRSLELSYCWRVIKDISPYNKIFVHFTDSMGNILFQNDHDFCTDYSFHKKIENKFIKETFLIYIPKSISNENLDIKIGIYDPISSKKCEIKSNGGLSVDYGNKAIIIKKAV
jgi:ABC-type Fe3+-citrate transport system substrate-binding protein